MNNHVSDFYEEEVYINANYNSYLLYSSFSDFRNRSLFYVDFQIGFSVNKKISNKLGLDLSLKYQYNPKPITSGSYIFYKYDGTPPVHNKFEVRDNNIHLEIGLRF